MKKMKKIAALASAAILGISTVPYNVLAADSYADAEKSALDNALETFRAVYGKSLESSKKAYEGQGVDFSLKLEDGAKSLLSAFLPVDLSWLDSIGINGDVTLEASRLGEDLTLKVNDKEICSAQLYMDMSTMDIYMSIPELIDGYIKVNANSAAQEEAEAAEDVADDLDISVTDDLPVDAENLTEYMDAMMKFQESMPEADTISNMIDKYLSIAVDHAAEAESGSETLSVDTVSVDCTTMEGTISGENLLPALTDIVEALKDDEDFKSIFESAAILAPDADYTYDDFQSSLDEVLDALQSEDISTEDITQSFTSKIWIDSDDNVVGHELSYTDEEGSHPFFLYQTPTDGNNAGYRLHAGLDDSSIDIVGSGQVTDGTLTGYYELSVDSQPILGITVSDYDTESLKTEGLVHGSYDLSIFQGDMDDSTYETVSAFGIKLTLDGMNFALDLSMSGTPLATLSAQVHDADPVTFVDPSEMDPIYDVDNDEDGDAFASSMSLDTILQNLTDAGMPADFFDTLVNGSSDTTDADTDTMDDTFEDDTAADDDTAIGDTAE